MRGLTLLAGCLLLAGCSSGPLDDPSRVFEQNPPLPDLDTVEKIEIAAGQSGGIPGAPLDNFELALVTVGPCRATVTHGNNYNSDNRTITRYDLPSEMFDECRKLLKETDFFHLQSARPEMLFENSSSSVAVTCGGRTHTVNVVSPAKAAEGYDKLYNFVTGAEKRGKEVN